MSTRVVLSSILTVLLAAAPLDAGSAYSSPKCTPSISFAGPEELIFSFERQSCKRNLTFTDNRASGFIDNTGLVSLLLSNGSATYRLTGPSLNQVTLDCSAPVMQHNPLSSNAGPQALWNDTYMHSPYTVNGKIVYMLIHNEYHADSTNNPQANCGCTTKATCEPRKTHCWYPTTVAAKSLTKGKHFTQVRRTDGSPQPAIASWYKYAPPPANPPFPKIQGVLYQTNIVARADADGTTRYYLFASTTLTGPGTLGDCLFRNPNVADPTGWRGWNGTAYSVKMNFNPYRDAIPSTATSNTCQGIANAPASFTYNTALGLYVGTSKVTAGTDGASVVEFVSSPDLLNWTVAASLVLPMNTGEGGKYEVDESGQPFLVMYTSMLDPQSTGLNFESSGTSPYLYFVRPALTKDLGWHNRDVYRVPLQVACQ